MFHTHVRRCGALAASLATAAGALLAGCGSSTVEHLLDLSASGQRSTSPFRTSRAWDLLYSWDCSGARARRTPGADQFGFQVFNADDDTLAAQQPQLARSGTGGQGTLHYTRSGPYYVQVTTVCDWRLQVLSRA